MAHILIVEDEEKIANIINDYLSQAGFDCLVVADGNHVLDAFNSDTFDLILLDLMLPNKDGLTLCKELRAFSQVPIIMVTARVEEIDKLLGLDIGADDYICKPFSPREVVARVKSLLRRTNNFIENSAAVIQFDDEKLQARVHQQLLDLTAIEYNLLNILAKEPGRIFSRAQLITMVYQDHRVVSERTIDSHIKKLRKKLNEVSAENELVQSVYSVGYKFAR